MKNIIGLCIIILLFACQEDDVCVEGSTPNLVIKFKSESGDTIITRDTLLVQYHDSDNLLDTIRFYGQDSITIPLRIDGGHIGFGFLESTQDGASKDSLAMNYTPNLEYVSKACGLKQVFESVSYQLVYADSIQNIEALTPNIINSNEVHLYLLY